LEKGFTEPDPREDLMGNDVGRKLLILARELDLENELSEVVIQNLIPDHLASLSKDEFLNRIEELDETFAALKANQKEDHVLRYVGDLSGDLQQSKGNLEVKLVSVPKQSP
jgi:aspartokinase/homoserine dehydrogenase 1